MLVLSRRTNEVIKIGDEISVTVTEVKGNRVKLGITAPANVRVRRSELRDNDAGPSDQQQRKAS